MGNTTFKVRVYISDTASETFEDKVLRLVRNDSSLSGTEERKEDEAKEE